MIIRELRWVPFCGGRLCLYCTMLYVHMFTLFRLLLFSWRMCLNGNELIYLYLSSFGGMEIVLLFSTAYFFFFWSLSSFLRFGLNLMMVI